MVQQVAHEHNLRCFMHGAHVAWQAADAGFNSCIRASHVSAELACVCTARPHTCKHKHSTAAAAAINRRACHAWLAGTSTAQQLQQLSWCAAMAVQRYNGHTVPWLLHSTPMTAPEATGC
jgi:hypothetical protein